MKLSNDQKKIAKSLALYPIIFIATTIISHVIKGNVDWTEMLWDSITAIVTSIVIGVLFILGSSIPKK